MSTPAKRNEAVVLVGCGNIGSHTAAQLARLGLARLWLVDHDVYEASNLLTQACFPEDLGRPKAEALAQRLGRLCPGTEIIPCVQRVELMPWGMFRQAQLVLGCVDSLQARYYLHYLSRCLGLPYLDAGVQGDALLGRLTLYDYAPQSACLECRWGSREYAALGVRRPCLCQKAEPASGSPSYLGAFVGAMQALEAEKILQQTGDHALGYELIWDTASRTFYKLRLTRRPTCAFSHQEWQLRLFGGATLAELVKAAQEALCAPPQKMSSQFHAWVCRLLCPACQQTWPTFTVAGRMPRPLPRCPQCQQELLPSGFDTLEQVELAEVAQSLALADIALRPGDIVSLGTGQAQAHFIWQPQDGGPVHQ